MFQIFFAIFFLIFSLQGCLLGFTNAQRHIPKEFFNVYVPAAQDVSIYGGNSSRLSVAVRQKLAERTDLNLTSLQKARWAMKVTVLNRVQSIVAVDSCKNPSTPTVASGAFTCTAIHPEFTTTQSQNTSRPTSFNQPSVSPSQERISLVVQVRAIDLKTGAILWTSLYTADNIPPVVFNEIGDTDGSTMKYMQWTPDLHALRYQETVDAAVQAFSNAIALNLQADLFSYLPKNNAKINK
jgi:hypothetical protein